MTTHAPLIVIAGPTGVGKSALAIALAERLGGEIVNYDSVQIYRGFDIGSAKPSAADRARVPHHLFDIADPEEDINAADFSNRAHQVIRDIRARDARPILVGGTNFYLRAIISGLPELPGKNERIRARLRRILDRPGGPERLYRRLARIDPVTAARVAPRDRHRIERALEVYLVSGRPISSWPRPSAESAARIDHTAFAITMARPLLHERLDARVDQMYARGLVEETRGLLANHSARCRPFQSIGYREAMRHLGGEMSLAEAVAETKRRTRAYAKRQMTWLRGERGVHWLDGEHGLEPMFEHAIQVATTNG